jgi:hypothetical protein
MLRYDVGANLALYVRCHGADDRHAPGRLPRRRLLAVALTVFGQLNLRFNIDGSTRYGPTFATAATTALATAVIALRRRASLLTVCVVTAAMAGPELVTRLTITLWGSFVPLVICGSR